MLATSLPAQAPDGIVIDTQNASIEAYVASHVGYSERPLGIAKPANQGDIERLIGWANQHKVGLVPVSSSGGPRRRADTALSVPAVVVDLSTMDRLIHAEGRDSIALIEPGMTFPAFDRALASHGLRSIKPLMPRSSKSVLASFLEREPTLSPNDHWDTTDPLAALSIVFGSGEPFRTGGASLPGTLEENLKRGNRQMMASGPLVTDYGRVLCGSQGTLGIVTWGSVYCERIPECEQAFLYGANDFSPLAELSRQLALHQLGAQFFVLNRTQFLAAMCDSTATFEQLFAECTQGDTLSPWLLYVNLTASDHLPEQKMQWQTETLWELAEQAGARLIPSKDGLTAAMLSQRLHQPPLDYYKDTPRGLHKEVFCLTQLDKVQAMLDAVSPLTTPDSLGGIRLGVYVQPTIQGVSCHLEFCLFHDASEERQAVQRVKELHVALSGEKGFFSRPYDEWAKTAFENDTGIVPYLRTVKEMFDPNGILNPGKLCF